jgi:hypothetical protein
MQKPAPEIPIDKIGTVSVAPLDCAFARLIAGPIHRSTGFSLSKKIYIFLVAPLVSNGAS